MVNTIQKPKFEEVVAFINLPDVGLKFNPQKFGPSNFAGLRQAEYGPGSRMSTMPELVPFVYASLENQKCKTAKKVVQTLKQYWLTGNISILYVPEGMFTQDDPELRNGRISMDQKTLEKRLGSHEERGVVFSKDKHIRFIPYGFKRESQSALELARNPGVIALTGSEENAEMFAKTSGHYRSNPFLWALSDVDSPQIRVAGLGLDEFGGGLGVFAGGSEDDWDRYSFGVFEDTKATSP